jgi:Ca-activated chloride channel homolog
MTVAARIACSMRSDSTCRNRRVTRTTASFAAILAGVVVVWAPPLSGQATEQPVARLMSPFRSGTELVPLQVAVVDPSRRYVPGLRVEDFAVFEEGVRQDVTLFAAATAPLDVMLLLDMSFSMVQRIEVTQEAAINFVRALGEGDRAAVVPFNQVVRVTQPLTDDLARVEDAIRAASPSGGTAVYEAVYIALRELTRARRDAEQFRRQALVVLTDGLDNSSHVALADVLSEARRSTVTVYTVVPPSGVEESFPRNRPLPLFDLRKLAEETGGRTFVPARLEDLATTYREIAEELSQQYWLAYVPTVRAEGFRRVSVRVATRPELSARTRSGYEASTPRSRR